MSHDGRTQLVDGVVLAVGVAGARSGGVLGVPAIAGDPAVDPGAGRCEGDRPVRVVAVDGNGRAGEGRGAGAGRVSGTVGVEDDRAAGVARRAAQGRLIADRLTRVDTLLGSCRDRRLVLGEGDDFVAAIVVGRCVVEVA